MIIHTLYTTASSHDSAYLRASPEINYVFHQRKSPLHPHLDVVQPPHGPTHTLGHPMTVLYLGLLAKQRARTHTHITFGGRSVGLL